jgi:hypothetical protein
MTLGQQAREQEHRDERRRQADDRRLGKETQRLAGDSHGGQGPDGVVARSARPDIIGSVAAAVAVSSPLAR